MPPNSQEKHSLSSKPIFIVVMGVSGTGKSTLGAALAHALGMPYVEGDDLHTASNIAKMSAGTPLTDADREPWLAVIRETAERTVFSQSENKDGSGYQEEKEDSRQGVVISSSALRRYYRDILRGIRGVKDTEAKTDDTLPRELPTYFVFIEGSRDLLFERMEKRSGHFMKVKMLESQLDTLEDPTGEDGVVVVSMQDSTEEQVKSAVEALSKLVK